MSATEVANSAANSEDFSCKLFVGNLSYQTREVELKDIFSKAGTVVDATIISFHNRSKGYGFVKMSSEEEADRAVSELKGHEFDGRAINVERATPQAPRSESGRSTGDASRTGGFRRGGIRRGGSRGGSRRTGAPRTMGPASPTVIYVGNLPFNAGDEDLTSIFQGYNVVKAHVVRRANGSSKGFGFVTVQSEEDQKRALTELLNVECDDRKLHIKAAHSEEPFDERDATATEAN